MLLLRGHRNSVRALAFSPSGEILASASDDASVRFWDATTGEMTGVWDSFRRPVQCVAFAPNGRTAYASGDEGFVARWDCPSAQPDRLLGRMDGPIVAQAVSPDGRLVAVGRDRTSTLENLPGLALFDALSETDIVDLAVADAYQPAWSLAFAPDGHTLAVGRNDGQVVFIDIRSETRQRIVRRIWTGVGVRALAYAPDGRTLVISPATPVLVYDVEADAIRYRLGEPGHAIESLAFCPDSSTLATGCQDSTVRLWDVHLGVEKARFDWQLGRIYAVAVSPDGMRAAAGGFNGDIILFDVDV